MGTLTPGDAQDLLGRYRRALETRDVDLAVSLFTPDADVRTDPFEASLSGANAIRAWWNAMVAGIASVEFDIERIWVSGETVLASYHAAWTERTTAERTRQRGFLTLELAPGGLVSRLRGWSRTQTVGRDATFSPEATATPMAG